MLLIALLLLFSSSIATQAGAAHGGTCGGGAQNQKWADGTIGWANGGPTTLDGIDYYNVIQEEAKTDSNSWHNYTDLNLVDVAWPGTGTDDFEVMAWDYGDTGWLGMADIERISNCTILEGNVRLNHFYIKTYGDKRSVAKYVACHEIGHMVGWLDHRGVTSSCMYVGTAAARNPDSHDKEVIDGRY